MKLSKSELIPIAIGTNSDFPKPVSSLPSKRDKPPPWVLPTKSPETIGQQSINLRLGQAVGHGVRLYPAWLRKSD